MISDYDNFYGSDPLSSSWEKVTKRIVDPITFSCHVNVTYVPRIEDCSYETTNIAIGQPRFGESLTSATSNGGKLPSSSSSVKKSSTNTDDDNAWKPHAFPPASPTPSARPVVAKLLSPAKEPKSTKQPHHHSKHPTTPAKHIKNMVAPTKSGGAKVASLGAFFSQASIQEPKKIETDNQSVGSRSISSRSVSELSNAERSRSEEKLKSRRTTSNKGSDMMSIDEQSVSKFIQKKKASKTHGSSGSVGGGGGVLGKFLNDKGSSDAAAPVEDDNRSMMSASTIGSKSVKILGTADRSKNEKRLKSERATAVAKHEEPKLAATPESPKKERQPSKIALPLKSILKKEGAVSKKGRKLDFKEGHDICEVPTLDDKEHYRDWDDIWYTEEELGDMRYEAFLEEAGLDVEEFM